MKAQAKPALPPLFRAVLVPLSRFFRTEAIGGIVLFAAAVLALVWANSPLRDSYQAVFSRELSVGFGAASVRFSLGALINDGLMSIFFFVVGMEIKRELVAGELSSLPKAMLPAVAALGGMIVPALLYVAFNRGGSGAAGWAIPMATDIAFSIGCLTLLKGRISSSLLVFLTALAIFDDMGGILVIALFYGHGLHWEWLAGSAVVLAILFVVGRFEVRHGLAYAVGGVALWFGLHHAGIHATIAGVLLGLTIPARGSRPVREVLEGLSAHAALLLARDPEERIPQEELVEIEERIEELESPLDRFVHLLHPWVAFAIMPVFAVANSGVDLSGVSLADLEEPVLLGTLLGLFVGKQLGIFAFTFAAVRARLSPMPGNAPMTQLYGVSVVAGIGFTVALFIAGLAFPNDPRLLDQAKLGILLGSLLSGLVGYALLRLSPSAVAPSPR